jgi:hypothetical protein
MHLAEASLYVLISTSLAVFDISKAVENGVEITPVHENTSGIIRSVFTSSPVTRGILIECCNVVIPNRLNAL